MINVAMRIYDGFYAKFIFRNKRFNLFYFIFLITSRVYDYTFLSIIIDDVSIFIKWIENKLFYVHCVSLSNTCKFAENNVE